MNYINAKQVSLSFFLEIVTSIICTKTTNKVINGSCDKYDAMCNDCNVLAFQIGKTIFVLKRAIQPRWIWSFAPWITSFACKSPWWTFTGITPVRKSLTLQERATFSKLSASLVRCSTPSQRSSRVHALETNKHWHIPGRNRWCGRIPYLDFYCYMRNMWG